MKFPTLTPSLCASLARDVFSKNTGYSNKTNKALDQEICKSLLGTSYTVCSEIWNLVNPLESDVLQLQKAHPRHLFWALLFLNCYCTIPILTRVVGGVDDKTFREWSWLFVKEIANLKPRVVSVCYSVWLSHLFNFSNIIVSLLVDRLEESLSRMGRFRRLFGFCRRR